MDFEESVCVKLHSLSISRFEPSVTEIEAIGSLGEVVSRLSSFGEVEESRDELWDEKSRRVEGENEGEEARLSP